jgi:formylglycine-generating enzyme required for sulfatase activity
LPPPDDTLNLVGTTIADKYHVDSIVGEGGFAVVYKATHTIWKRPVAIKIFKSLADVAERERDKLLQDFIQEGALLAELSERSAAICQARDVGTLTLNPDKKDWLPYMVLEWLEGASLESVLLDEKAQGGPPRTLEQALRLLAPAAEALALAHRKGVAHRDIKPANIFLLGNPNEDPCPVKLLDFGIAKVVQDAQKASGTFTKTSGQITSFTPAYGAPEQFSRSHGATGPWTDVFAFALVIVECLTYREPLEGDDYMQIAYASADRSRRPSPRGKGAVVSDEIEAIFLKALAVGPSERYKTMGEFWEALRKVLPSDSVRSLAVAEPVSTPGSTPGLVPVTAPGATIREPPISLAQTEAAPPSAEGMLTTTRGTVSTARTLPSQRPNMLALVGVTVASAAIAGVLIFYFTAKKHPALPPPPPAITMAPKPVCPPGMVHIPGGQFYMGSDDPRDLPMERPAHNVTLPAYCIDEFEVTTENYKRCSDKGGCKRASEVNAWEGIKPHDHNIYDPLCNIREPVARGKHPINCVDWDMASVYCQRSSLRLPTEAEWEFAARGPDGRRYPWGDVPPTSGHLNACGLECVEWGRAHKVEPPLEAMYPADDGYTATAPVGSFPSGKSRYGVQDVVGNVWEWVNDWYGPYGAKDETEPKGPARGTARVIRGGGWNGSDVAWVRPTFRYMDDPIKKSHGIGFRCAKTITSGP